MKRHRVRLRPKARHRRFRLAGVFAGVLALAAAGLLLVRAKPWTRFNFPAFSISILPRFARVESVSVLGAPPALERGLLAALDWKAGERWGPVQPYCVARRLREAYPCVRDIAVRRSWLSRSVLFDVALREPVAALYRSGRLLGYLGREGEAFEAPAGIYAQPLPVTDVTLLPAGTPLGELARLIETAGIPEALPAKLLTLRYDPAEEGWTAGLADGTALKWGALDWTEEKLERLREVFADALPRFGPLLAADLRHFEDGKILVRPR